MSYANMNRERFFKGEKVVYNDIIIMRKEWSRRHERIALIAIKMWFNSRTWETMHGELPYFCFISDMDEVLGLPYTSSGRAACVSITNTEVYLDKDHKFKVASFEMDENDIVYAVCRDTNENEILIPTQ